MLNTGDYIKAILEDYKAENIIRGNVRRMALRSMLSEFDDFYKSHREILVVREANRKNYKFCARTVKAPVFAGSSSLGFNSIRNRRGKPPKWEIQPTGGASCTKHLCTNVTSMRNIVL